MDDLDEPQASQFVTDNEDQDSLDERIETEQRLRNQQLWSSFQNAACCITELYKDRGQSSLPLWVPFQNAASNLTTLYKDCIESQRKFAKIGYQIGRRRRYKELNKLHINHKLPIAPTANATYAKHHQQTQLSPAITATQNQRASLGSTQFSVQTATTTGDERLLSTSNHDSSILAVNQLNLDCDESPSNSEKQAQVPLTMGTHQIHPSSGSQQQQSNMQSLLSNNEDHLLTFQQALGGQPASLRANVKLCPNKHPICQQASGQPLNCRSVDHNKSEEDRLLELNQFLSEEYHRHVGSRKRTSSGHGGSTAKRFRD